MASPTSELRGEGLESAKIATGERVWSFSRVREYQRGKIATGDTTWSLSPMGGSQKGENCDRGHSVVAFLSGEVSTRVELPNEPNSV